jgi:hypothetical protein
MPAGFRLQHVYGLAAVTPSFWLTLQTVAACLTESCVLVLALLLRNRNDPVSNLVPVTGFWWSRLYLAVFNHSYHLLTVSGLKIITRSSGKN